MVCKRQHSLKKKILSLIQLEEYSIESQNHRPRSNNEVKFLRVSLMICKNISVILIKKVSYEIEFLTILKNNITKIPVKFDDSVFFEFLTQNEMEIWKQIIKKIF